MPVKSQAQFRLMAAIAHGNLKKKGLSKDKAKEFVDGVDYKGLPKFTKIKKMMRK